MRAIVLAAGFGRRMQPLTDTTHKTLLPIGGRAVIDWIIDALLIHEVTDITVVTGYRADDVRRHLSDTYTSVRFTYVHNDRYAETNNIYSLALALEQGPPDDIVLIESDLIFEPAVLERLLRSPHGNVALVDYYRLGMDGTVVSIADGIVAAVTPTQVQGPAFDYSDKYKTLNIYKFARDFCEGDFRKLLTYYAQVIDDNCYYELILGILIYLQREVIHAEVLRGEQWAEVDTPDDLNVASYLFDPSQRKRILDESHGGYWNFDVLDFCYLRNPYFPTGAVLSELRNHLQILVENYGSSQAILDRKLAYFLQCDAARVVALHGAAQIFPMLPALCGSGRVLLPSPSFLEYSRAFPGARTYADAPGIDTGTIEAEAHDADVIVFVNPNNPTGSSVPTAWIEDFARRHPAKTIVVDESFADFSSDRSVMSRLEERPCDNVLVVKSLSKPLGVPGLRLGFAYSTGAGLIAPLRQELPIWNLNSITEFFLETILKYRVEIQASFRKTIVARDELAARLLDLAGVERVYPSSASFLLVRLANGRSVGPVIVDALLRNHGVYLKDVSARLPGDSCFLRIGVRQPEDNRRLVEGLTRVTESVAPSQAYGR